MNIRSLTKVRHDGIMQMRAPFALKIPGEKKPLINGKILKDTQQTTKVFPLGMRT